MDHTQGFYAVVNVATFDLHSVFPLLVMSSPGFPNELLGEPCGMPQQGWTFVYLLVLSLAGITKRRRVSGNNYIIIVPVASDLSF